MSLLLGLIPSSLSRWLLGLLAIAAVCGYAFYRGVGFEHDKMQLTIDAIQHAGDQQALASGQKDIHNQGVVQNVVQDFHSNITAINDYWLRKQANSHPGGVPKVPATTSGAAGSCADTGATGPSQEVFDELEHACAITTQMFNSCRDGWMKQEK